MRPGIALLVPLLLAGGCAATGRPSRALTPVKFGAHTLMVEVADQEPERSHGLMFRREMGKNEGMLFVFEEPHQASFWMKNTPLPLSIAYLDEKRVILNIEQMAPYDDQTYHLSKGLALYAVEAHRGWFEKNGIKAGDVAEFTLPGPNEKERP